MARRRSSPPKFDAAWQRRRRLSRVWRSSRFWLALAALLALGWWLRQAPDLRITERLGFGPEWQVTDHRFSICGQRSATACVVDGDTVMIGNRRIRLTGFDAPELDGTCEAERLLAVQAREVLQGWLNSGAFDLDGGAEPPRDQYGRELREARRMVAGRSEWLADAMVQRGLARNDTTNRDWCS